MKRKNNDNIEMSKLEENLYNKIIYSLTGDKIFYPIKRAIIYPVAPYGMVLAVSKVPGNIEFKDSYNDYFIGNSYIISPFILNKYIPFDRETKELVQWLKENMGLEELSKWVVENSAQPDQYKPNIDQVMKSYEDLIGEYQRVYKLKQDEEEK